MRDLNDFQKQIKKHQKNQSYVLQEFEIELLQDVWDSLSAKDEIRFLDVDLEAGVITFYPIRSDIDENEFISIIVMLPRINNLRSITVGIKYARNQVNQLKEGAEMYAIGICSVSVIGAAVNNINKIIEITKEFDEVRSRSTAIVLTNRKSTQTMMDFLIPLFRSISRKELEIYTVRKLNEVANVLRSIV